METAAKRLHDFLEEITRATVNGGDPTGSALSEISKAILKQKDGGASIIRKAASLLEQIEESINSIPGIRDYQAQSYLRSITIIRSFMAPASMLRPWSDVRHAISENLGALIMIDHALEFTKLHKLSKEEIEDIAAELEETQQLINNAEGPDYVKRVISLEIEKLKMLLRSEAVWNEERFLNLYQALSAKILAASDAFKQGPQIRQKFMKMFLRVRSLMGLSADAVQLAEATTKLISSSGDSVT